MQPDRARNTVYENRIGHGSRYDFAEVDFDKVCISEDWFVADVSDDHEDEEGEGGEVDEDVEETPFGKGASFRSSSCSCSGSRFFSGLVFGSPAAEASERHSPLEGLIESRLQVS